MSFKLESFTAANQIAHGQAHDALADVRATIAVARLLRERQPKLFDYLYGLRRKKCSAGSRAFNAAYTACLWHVFR